MEELRLAVHTESKRLAEKKSSNTIIFEILNYVLLSFFHSSHTQLSTKQVISTHTYTVRLKKELDWSPENTHLNETDSPRAKISGLEIVWFIFARKFVGKMGFKEGGFTEKAVRRIASNFI